MLRPNHLLKHGIPASIEEKKQLAYNKKHGITLVVIRPVQESLRVKKEDEDDLAVAEDVSTKDVKSWSSNLKRK